MERPAPTPSSSCRCETYLFPYSCCLNFQSPKFHIFKANLKQVYFHSFHYNGKTYKSKSYIYNKNLFQMPFTTCSYLCFDSEEVNYFNYILHFIVNMYIVILVIKSPYHLICVHYIVPSLFWTLKSRLICNHINRRVSCCLPRT